MTVTDNIEPWFDFDTRATKQFFLSNQASSTVVQEPSPLQEKVQAKQDRKQAVSYISKLIYRLHQRQALS
jgi:hypothetical protein